MPRPPTWSLTPRPAQVLAAKDPHGHFQPASTLKILTADTLMPVLQPGRRTVVTSHRWRRSVTPSRVGLIQGHRYRVADLFRALLLISANDAAIALAQATGSYRRGVAMMNAEARHLQAGRHGGRAAQRAERQGPARLRL